MSDAKFHSKKASAKKRLRILARRFPVPPVVTPNYLAESLEERMLLAAAPMGAEFRVNTTTTNTQTSPAAAMAADGSAVAVWQSLSQDGSGYGIYGQRYGSSGQPVGGEFAVNTTTANDQTVASIAMDLAGDYLVAWMSNLQDGDQTGIYARRYNAATGTLGGEFRVNTTTSGAQAAPWVAMDAIGDSVVVWTYNGSIYGQRYDLYGAAIGGEFLINTSTVGTQASPRVAMDARGDFVVAWQSAGSNGTHVGVFARRFDLSGAALGTEFQVSNVNVAPALAMPATGGFDIIINEGSLQLRRYGADGVQVGSVITVNAGTGAANNGAISGYSAAFDASGELVVVWKGTGASGGNADLMQLVEPDGTRLGHDVRLNATTIADSPIVARSPKGDFLVLWSVSSGASEVYARRYQPIDNAASVGDRTWNDVNGDGIQEAGEGIWANAQLQLFTSDGVLVDEVGSGPIMGTGYLANYRFDELVPGQSYYLQLSLPPFSQASLTVPYQGNQRALDSDFDPVTRTTSTFSLSPGQADMTKDAGLFTPTVGGTIFEDINGDGTHALTGEPTLQGWVAYLDLNHDGKLSTGDVTATTSSSGSFSFTNVPRGTYQVGYVLQQGWTQSSGTTIPPLTVPSAHQGVAIGVQTDASAPLDMPFSPDLQLNTFSTNDQSAPAVAVDGSGDGVAVWVSHAQDGSLDGIYGQRIDSAGNRHGAEFRISTSTSGDQREPAVGIDALGNFTVVWSNQTSATTWDLMMRRFDSAGNPLGPETTVTATPADSQIEPTIAINASGAVAVVWNKQASTTSPDVFARFYDAAGNPRGDAFRVNDQLGAFGSRPGAALDAAGNLTVVWSRTTGTDIDIRRFDANGAPLGAEAFASTITSSPRVSAPVIAMEPGGRFAVAWQQVNGVVYVRRFDSSGIGQGAEIAVDTSSNLSQPALAMRSDGSYYVAWAQGNTSNGSELKLRSYDAAGIRSSSIFAMNVTVAGDQTAPAIAIDDSGKLLATWKTVPATGASSEIMSATAPVVWQTGSLGGVVWNDANGDGIRQAEEVGSKSLSVKLLSATGTVLQTKTTATDGSYRFDGLIPGQPYSIQFSTPNGYVYTLRDVGGDDSIDSDADRSTGRSDPFTPSSGQVKLDISAGIAQLGAIAATVFIDANHNGQQDTGEIPVPYTTLFLDSNLNGVQDAGEPSSTTDSTGRVVFASLQPNVYSLVIVPGPHLSPPSNALAVSPIPNGTRQVGFAMASDVPLNVALPDGPVQHFADYPSQGDGKMALVLLPSGEYWGLAMMGGNLVLAKYDNQQQQVSSRILDVLQLGSDQSAWPQLGQTPSGDLIASWVSYFNDGQVKVERFDPQGNPKGGPTIVAQGQNGVLYLSWSKLAIGPAGDFAVAWMEGYSSPQRVKIRHFSAAGLAAGPTFSPAGSLDQISPSVAIDKDDNLLLAWASPASDGQWYVNAQRFAPSGTPLGTSFHPGGDAAAKGGDLPMITMGANGEYAISWTTGGGAGRWTQWYNALGQPQGQAVPINASAIATNGNGLYLFATAGLNPTARWYLTAGIPLSDPFALGDGSGHYASALSAAVLPDGQAMIVLGKTTGNFSGEFHAQMLSNQPHPSSSIGGVVWTDSNADGIRQAGETGLDGVGLLVYQSDGILAASTTTAGGGQWHVDGLFPGRTYSIVASIPPGQLVSPANQGGDDLADSDFDAQGKATIVTPAAGTADLTLGLGLYGSAMIYGRIYYDANSNGTADSGEMLANWTAYLDDNQNGQLDMGELVSMTGRDGVYNFANLWPGEYHLAYIAPAGFDSINAQTVVLPPAQALGSDIAAHTNSPPYHAGPITDPVALIGRPLSGVGQFHPAAATSSNGTAVVVWGASVADLSASYIYGQLIAANGALQGPTFIISPLTGALPVLSVAMNASGDFIVTWQSSGSPLQAQRYNATGAKVGGVMVLSGAPGGGVAMDDAGDSAVVGEVGLSGSTRSIYVNRYLADGTRLDPIQFSTGVPSNQDPVSPALAMNGSGAFVIGWRGGSINSKITIRSFATFESDQAVASEVWPTLQGGAAGSPGLALNDSGVLVAAWGPVAIDAAGDYAIAGGGVNVYNVAGFYGGGTSTPSQAIAMRPDGSFLTAGTWFGNMMIQSFAPYNNPGSISGVAWLDANGDGIRNSGESGFAGVEIDLNSPAGWPYASTTTRSDGAYSFPLLPPGIPYVIKLHTPQSYVITTVNAGQDDTVDSDFDVLQGTVTLTLSIDQAVEHLDAGFVPAGSVSGTVFNDVSGDGIRGPSEPGVAGLVAYADLSGDGVKDPGEPTATTNATGIFSINGLPPGAWSIRLQNQNAWKLVGTAPAPPLAVGQALSGVLIPVQAIQPDPSHVSVAGVTWEDVNGDGIRQSSEPLITNATVSLLDANGATLATTSTTGGTLTGGAYRFDLLTPGAGYQLKVVVGGKLLTLMNAGGDRSIDSDFDPSSSKVSFTAAPGGSPNVEFDAGFVTATQVQGTIFHDLNGDGTMEPSEPALSGWTVYLDVNHDGSPQPTEPSAITTANGTFSFPSVDPGVYALAIALNPGWSSTTASPMSITVLGGQPLSGLVLGIQVSDAPFITSYPTPEFKASTSSMINTPIISSAVDANGNFVLVWTDQGSGNITARRFDASGTPLGNEFKVNTSLGYDAAARIAMDAAGDFVVAWTRAASGGATTATVLARRYDPRGNPLSGEVTINSTLIPANVDLDIAMSPSGQYAITWTSTSASTAQDIQVRVYNAAGQPLAPEFQANTTTTSNQRNPAIGMDATGNFTLVWDSTTTGSSWQVMARRFAADGTPLGGEFRVGSATSNVNFTPALAETPDGQFAVAWLASGAVFAQCFDASGSPTTAQFTAIASSVQSLDNRSIAMDGAGNLMVASWGNIGGQFADVYVQRISPGGVNLGPRIKINTVGQSSFGTPVLRAVPGGNVLAAWPTLANVSQPGVYVSFITPGKVAVSEDAGPVSIPNFALSYLPGTLSYSVTNDNPTLFSVPPAINSSGTLTFTPAADAFGQATLSISLAGTTLTSVLNVLPVNDPPTIAPVPAQVLSAGAAATIPLAVTPGPNPNQQVVVSAIAANPSFFSQFQLDTSGDSPVLQFQLSPSAQGTTTIYLIAQDNGGTNPGRDSAASAFTVSTPPDTTPPTAQIDADRAWGTSTIDLSFSEPVKGFDLNDLVLSRNGTPLSIFSSAVLVQVDATHWLLAGLSGVTAPAGQYQLQLTAAGSGIADLHGNALQQDVSVSWSVSGNVQLMASSTPSSPAVVTIARDPLSKDLLNIRLDPLSDPLVVSLTTLTSLSIQGGDGDDVLTVDESFPWVTPAGTLLQLAGLGGSDTLRLIGAATNDTLLLAANSITFDGLSLIPNADVENLQFVGGGGADTVTATSGNYRISADLGAGNASVGLSLDGNAAIELAGPQHLSLISLAGASQLKISADSRPTLVTGGLQMQDSALLDLGNSNLIVEFTGDSPEEALRGWVRNWSSQSAGPKLLASQSDDSSSQFLRTLAISDNRDLKFTSFAGQTFAPGDFNQILVEYTYFGDGNLDDQVTPRDYAIIDGNIGLGHDWGTGDLNGDGKVSPSDYTQIDGNIGAGTGGAGGPQLTSLLAEPPSISMPSLVTENRLTQDAPAPEPALEIQFPVPAARLFSTSPIHRSSDLLEASSPDLLV